MTEEAAALFGRARRRRGLSIVRRLNLFGFIAFGLHIFELEFQVGELFLQILDPLLGFRAVFTAAQVMTAFRDDTLRF